MTMAWAMGIVIASFCITYVHLGVMEDGIQPSLSNFDAKDGRKKLILKLHWISTLPLIMSFYLCKAALLSVYHQVIPRFMTKRRTFLWVTVGYVVVSFITTVTLLFTICTPVNRWWSLESDSRCEINHVRAFYTTTWALNFTSDIFIFVLPWLIVPDLMIKGWLRIGIYFTFLLGLINMAITIVRYTQVYAVKDASLVTTRKSHIPLHHQSYAHSPTDFWASLDLYIGLVISCLPALRPYFKYAAESRAFNYMKSKTGTRGGSQYTGTASTASTNAKMSNQGKGSFGSSTERLSQLSLVHIRAEDERSV
jgi:hypothetical protein